MSSPLTTHVLDTARGTPAAGVALMLEREDREGWARVADGRTDEDGRCKDLLGPGGLTTGNWRITFQTAEYYQAHGSPCFYPYAQITFTVTHPDQHHHVPLLLAPYGFSTYRGS